MSKKKIIICCPGKSFSSQFLGCLSVLTRHFDNKGYDYRLSTTYSRNIYETRNKCLFGNPEGTDEQVPFNGEDYTHILWIDDDITFTPDDFETLLEADKNVISGFYIMADGKHYAAVKVWDERYFQQNSTFPFMTPDDIKDGKKPTRVEYVGFGFLLVKKGIFERMSYPWFKPTTLYINDAIDFSMEDVTFCLRCKDIDVSVFAHPKVIVGHNKVIQLKM